MGNHIQKCEPTLKRDKLYPGNMIEGNLHVVADADVNVYGIRISVIGRQYQKYITSDGRHYWEHEEKIPFSITTATCFGGDENSKQEHTLQKGSHNFPFAMLLSPAALPSARVKEDDEEIAIEWYVRAVVDVAGRFNEGGKAPFQVYSLIPQQKWLQPSAQMKTDVQKVKCCGCCCAAGAVQTTIKMSKTVVAMDRDAVYFDVEIDNTGGDDKITGLNVALVVSAQPKVGFTHLAPKTKPVKTAIQCLVEPGKKGSARGSLQLTADSCPSVSSSVVNFIYTCDFSMEQDGCCIGNAVFSIPAEVFHSVDDSGAAEVMQQLQMNVKSLDAKAMENRGVYEVPNLFSNRNSPAHNQVAPQVPPPGWPPQGFPVAVAHQDQESLVGPFPGFMLYPEANPYFQQQQAPQQQPLNQQQQHGVPKM